MNIEDFCDKVEGWATERGIYQHGTEAGQWLKALSEFGELCDGIAKARKGEVMDAIGDIAVCIVNANNLSDYPDRVDKAFPEILVAPDGVFIQDLGNNLLEKQYYNAMCSLMTLASHFGLSYGQCFDAAWDEIRDRKGHMNKNGVFIKENDFEVPKAWDEKHTNL